jgi:stromal membrane-associated protein
MAKECGSSSVIVGVVKVKVVRGTNLAVRDVFSSDPYVVLKLGNQVISFTLSTC